MNKRQAKKKTRRFWNNRNQRVFDREVIEMQIRACRHLRMNRKTRALHIVVSNNFPIKKYVKQIIKEVDTLC